MILWQNHEVRVEMPNCYDLLYNYWNTTPSMNHLGYFVWTALVCLVKAEWLSEFD